MSAAQVAIDLDDTDGLIAADSEAMLRTAAMAGAQVRATAAAVDEGALDAIGIPDRPRSLIWIAGRGTAERAGAVLSAAMSASAAEPIVVAAEAPPWIGPLDVLVLAGDDPGDPALVASAAAGVRRGARVVVAAPHEGPLRDVTAGRAAVLEPRLPVADGFALCRYLAAGLATLQKVDPAVRVDLATLADDLDAEAFCNSVGRELFTNPAKALAERMTGRSVAVVGDTMSTVALARHTSATLLGTGIRAVAAAGLSEALAALSFDGGRGSSPDQLRSLFHDEQLDGPLPDRLRVLALTLAAQRPMLAARLGDHADIDLVWVGDVPDGQVAPSGIGDPVHQLATLAVRLEMAAVYLRLARG